MNIKIPLSKPYIDKEDIVGVKKVLKSLSLSLGPKLKEFENEFANYVGSKYACGVSSGTAGLHLAIKALGLKKDDEVITSPFSFIASTNCILYENLKPVFVDINENTFNIDPYQIKKKITKKTKAIIVIHVFGQPAEMNLIIKIAKKHGLKIIEDACESLGSKYYHRKTGTMGDIGVFAFYPNKQITTGEGGMIVTNNKNIYKDVLSLRNQGRNLKNKWLIHEKLGYNYRMNEISASLGITQLKKINWIIQERNKIAKLYFKYLSGNKNIILPILNKNNNLSWFVFVIRIINNKRDYIAKKLLEEGIETRNYFPPIHLQPFIKKMFNYKIGSFPITEKISSQTLALPFFIGLKEKEIKNISQLIKKLL